MPRPALVPWLVLLALTAGAAARKSCLTDGDCTEAYLGLLKLSNGQLVPDPQSGSCCKGTSNGTCYYAPMEKCVAQSGAMPDRYKSLVCFQDEIACGAQCCDPYTEVCQSYKERSGRFVYGCSVRLDDALGFWIIGLPVILSVLTVAGTGAAVAAGVGRSAAGLTLNGRLALGLALALTVCGVPFYFSSAWQYGVAIATTAALGVATSRVTYRPVVWIAALAHVALFLGLLGWGNGNVIFGSWAPGILHESAITCSPRYKNYFGRTTENSLVWADPAAAARGGANPSYIGLTWGYCNQNWFVTLWVFGAVDICLSAIVVALYVLRLAWDDSVTVLPSKSSA